MQQDTKYSINSQSFNFSIGGVKPYTTYTVYSDGYDLTCRVKPFGKNLGDPLITDQYGMMGFTLFYLDIPEKTGIVRNFPSVSSKTTDVQSDKLIYIIDGTKTSVITKVIPFRATKPGYTYTLTT